MERNAARLAHWIAESRGTIGLELRGIVPLSPTTWLFLLGTPGEPNLRARWLLTREPMRARFHVVPPRRDRLDDAATPDLDASPVAESPLLKTCRHNLLGLRVLGIEQPFRDRTLRIEFGADYPRRFTLIAELYGAAPRFILLDADDRSILVEPLPKTGDRLHHGKPYTPPPTGRSRIEVADPPQLPPVAAAVEPDLVTFAAEFPWSFAAHREFGELEQESRNRQRHARLVARTAAALGSARERVAALERESAGATLAEELRRHADVLAANLYRVKRGCSELETEDLYSDQRIRIELDPSVEPHENLRRLYQSADKKTRGAEYANRELPAVRARVADLSAFAAELDNNAPGAALPPATILRARELDLLREPRATPPVRSRARESDARHSEIRRFRLRSGIEALVGTSDRSNDHLTHRMARGNDWWMHVQSFEGAHVVLRVLAGKTPSLEDLLDAGRLAVHFSKRRGHDAVVMFTQKKYVRKGKGRAGAAMVDRHQELRVQHDERATRALLGTDRGGD